MLKMPETTQNQYQHFINEALTSTTLPLREQALIQLTLAIASHNMEEVRQAVLRAKNEGITTAEIEQVTALVVAQHTRRVLGEYGQLQVTEVAESSCCR
ncbi:carboxymuconolactone decarboxylase family protein [Deinococcus misasensis]|uniref:carboxymuconolactone decarboxylase family protein n=1 Tax=Deinococcus misasensis TaxID=392413 RepID=UPI000557E1E8|nr:carboxymuconolactone decarboxylase family protein [Deinococcus misasensis]